MSDNDNPIKYVDLGEEYLLRSLSLAELKNTLNELRVEESNTSNNDKHGSHWLLLQHSIKAFKAEITNRDSNHRTTVHSEMLDPFTRLEIRLHDVSLPLENLQCSNRHHYVVEVQYFHAS